MGDFVGFCVMVGFVGDYGGDLGLMVVGLWV